MTMFSRQGKLVYIKPFFPPKKWTFIYIISGFDPFFFLTFFAAYKSRNSYTSFDRSLGLLHLAAACLPRLGPPKKRLELALVSCLAL